MSSMKILTATPASFLATIAYDMIEYNACCIMSSDRNLTLVMANHEN